MLWDSLEEQYLTLQLGKKQTVKLDTDARLLQPSCATLG